jgi:hypothetical protein
MPHSQQLPYYKEQKEEAVYPEPNKCLLSEMSSWVQKRQLPDNHLFRQAYTDIFAVLAIHVS